MSDFSFTAKVCTLLLFACAGMLSISPAYSQNLEPATRGDDVAEYSALDDAETTAETKESEAAEQVNPLANLRIFGEIRHRSELNAKFTAPGEEIPRYHLLRTRLNVAFTPADDIIAVVQIQDSRLFGSENPDLGRGTLDASADALDFRQAYFAVTNFFMPNLSLKVGRQELAYGNQRFIGTANYSNTGRTFDAAVLSYRDEHRSIDLLTSRLVSTSSATASQNLHGIYSTFHYMWTHHADAFFLVDNDTEPLPGGEDVGLARLNRYTLGGSIYGKEDNLTYEFEFAGQRGQAAQTDSTKRATLNGYMVSGSLGFVVPGPSNFKGNVLFTLLSGDDTPSDQSISYFNQLLPSGHKFYGFIDFFPKFYTTYGLHDIAFQFAGKISDQIGWKADLHQFTTNKPVMVNDAELTSLGRELDLGIAFRYNHNFTVIAGSSIFMADELMESALGDNSAWTFNLATQVNF